ncbi:hypothetical protein RUM44_007088 [Polyplax serrata]|uniref:Uncharacterized protein n=1 Tax=Polyplax serrata TaxID=468196 RepID=A0ABR1AZQ7_POLSC
MGENSAYQPFSSRPVDPFVRFGNYLKSAGLDGHHRFHCFPPKKKKKTTAATAAAASDSGWCVGPPLPFPGPALRSRRPETDFPFRFFLPQLDHLIHHLWERATTDSPADLSQLTAVLFRAFPAPSLPSTSVPSAELKRLTVSVAVL